MPTWFEEIWEKLEPILAEVEGQDRLVLQMVAFAAVQKAAQAVEVDAQKEREAIRQLHHHLTTQGMERAAYRLRRWAEEEIGSDTAWMLDERGVG